MGDRLDYYKECHACKTLKESEKLRLLYKSKNFVAVVVDLPLFKPHIDRKDGGHIVIIPRKHISDRKDFSEDEAKEFILLSMLVGDAMYGALPKNEIDLAIINYQQNGNWSVDEPVGPHLHLHLYGRAKSSKHQKHGQALFFPPKGDPFYKGFKSLNEKDEELLNEEIIKLIKKPKYKLLKKLNKLR